MNEIRYSDEKELPIEKVVGLYTLLQWSSAGKPRELKEALRGSHTVITAWDGRELVGLGNAISDGHLVVYYPHLAVHPAYQRRGIGSEIMRRMGEKYRGFHQQAVVADGGAVPFYKRCGFEETGNCRALWIYRGNDHE
jgi:GNAT superfamily N-acetyltransferase